MEIFDELVECEVAIIVPHIKSIIEFSLQVLKSAQNIPATIDSALVEAAFLTSSQLLNSYG